MGKAAQTIFGGSSQSSQSSNQAYPFLQGALGGTIGQGTQAGSAIANMLGLNGAPAQNQGFQNFRNSTGYQFGLNQGMGAITGSAAAKGLLNSGGTLKALNTFGQDYASSKYGDYLNQLQNLLGSGLTGAGVLAGAGQQSSSEGSSSKGAGGFIGSLMGK
jgi:hypothetical protein